MAESNATQVILTDDGIKIINAQNTADNAASQAGNADSAALIAQSTANAAKSAADSNYNYANSEIAVQSNATAKAQSTADNAFSQAQAVGSQASAEISSNSTATAKAQSTADNAFSQATTAIDIGKVTSQAVTDLKDGSKLTIADLENGLATKVANSEYASYKVQTASQIAQKVDNGAFSAYQQTTADLIASKVATKDFSAYQATTAKEISSKVESSDFNTYKAQTADLIDDKVSSSEYASDKTQTASEIADRVSNSAFSTYQTQTASQIASKVDNGAFSAYQTTTADLIAQKVATSDFSAYQATTAKSISSKVESSDFNTYKTQTADMIASKVSTVDFNNLTISNRNLALGTATAFTMTGQNKVNQSQNAYQFSRVIPKETLITVTFDIASTTGVGTYTMQFSGQDTGSSWQAISLGNLVKGTKHISVPLTTDSDHLHFFARIDNATGDITVSNLIVSESSKEVDWTPAPEDQATQSQITQLSGDINLRVTKGGLIDEINLQAGNTLISSSGQLTLAADTIYFDTKKPVIIPNANITDTLNGKTFHGGDIISNANNTAKYYPMTITPDGAYKSTYFDGLVGLQSSVASGAIVYKYRSMISNSSGKYLAYDSVINGQGLDLQSGYTSAKDTTFSNPVDTTTGYVTVNANDGITLHGDDQQITFNGTSADATPKGIIITPYGNINPNGTQNIWYVGNGPTMKTASFGIDGSGANNIQFNRSLDIGNFNINTYHTITSSDNGPIHFNRANGSSVDIFAATVNYTSLVKSSLLSVKKDVKKADTAYWAQLVNSIDLATYQYKTDDNTSHLRLSSIVDDVNVTKQWQLPDVFISRDENGKLSGVDDSVLLNATLATVQEQQKQIDQLNGHNMELEARLNKLEAKLNG